MPANQTPAEEVPAENVPFINRRAIIRQALVVGLATGAYGISFGVLSISAGLGIAKTCVLSLAMFTGASQFALVSVVGSGGNPLTAAGNALLLGARNIAYGFTAAPLLPKAPLTRTASSHWVIDETVAMARAQSSVSASRLAYYATGASIFVLWNIGTVIGATAGGALDTQKFGLDAMFPAAFLALLVPQLRQRGATRAAVAGAILALIAVPLTPVGVPVLAAALGVTAAFIGRGAS